MKRPLFLIFVCVAMLASSFAAPARAQAPAADPYAPGAKSSPRSNGS